MILPPTSEISHHQKVTNITMSPTSLSATVSHRDETKFDQIFASRRFLFAKVRMCFIFINSGSPNRERHHSAGSQSLTKINQINMEPEFTQTTKKIKHQKSSSFSTLKRAKKEWKKLFK